MAEPRRGRVIPFVFCKKAINLYWCEPKRRSYMWSRVAVKFLVLVKERLVKENVLYSCEIVCVLRLQTSDSISTTAYDNSPWLSPNASQWLLSIVADRCRKQSLTLIYKGSKYKRKTDHNYRSNTYDKINKAKAFLIVQSHIFLPPTQKRGVLYGKMNEGRLRDKCFFIALITVRKVGR